MPEVREVTSLTATDEDLQAFARWLSEAQAYYELTTMSMTMPERLREALERLIKD